jgi:hypothetical protein
VPLHLTSPFADDILKLPPRCLEGITDRYINVLVSACRSGFPAYDNVGSIGNHEMNPDVKDVTLVMAVLRAANHHPAADDPAKELLKLGSFLPDTRLDNIGMLNAFEGDLKGNLHCNTSSRAVIIACKTSPVSLTFVKEVLAAGSAISSARA